MMSARKTSVSQAIQERYAKDGTQQAGQTDAGKCLQEIILSLRPRKREYQRLGRLGASDKELAIAVTF